MALGSRHQEVLISETLLTTRRKKNVWRGCCGCSLIRSSHCGSLLISSVHWSWCCTVGYTTLLLATAQRAGSPRLYILTTCLEKFRMCHAKDVGWAPARNPAVLHAPHFLQTATHVVTRRHTRI